MYRIRTPRPGISLAVVLAMAHGVAHADRHTTEATTLRKHAGEKAAALANLAADTSVTVLAEEGRWLKVRANGVVGYLTRTTVSDSEPARPAGGEATHVWGADHPRDHITTSTSAGAAPAAAASTTSQAAETSYQRPARGDLVIRAELGLGFRSLGMDLHSNVDGGLANYLLSADAAAAELTAGATQALGARLRAGVDLRTAASNASPGIAYGGPTSPPGKIAFQTFEVDAGARAGLVVRDGIDVALRLGGHYDAFLPRDVNNAGMLPRERLLGATAGVRGELAPPRSRFGASLRFDVMVVGSRAQTHGLEDGTSSSAHAFWGGATLRCAATEHVTVFAGYEFARASTDWSGMSTRTPGATTTTRTDTGQVLLIGVGAEL